MVYKLAIEITKGLNIRTFLFLPSERSSSANFMLPFMPDDEPEIPFYANQEGVLVPLISGSLPDPVATRRYLIGVRVNGRVLPLFDRYRRWILVTINNGQVVVVSPRVYHAYAHRYPPSIISQLENRNNVEFVMPIRPRNGSPNSPANRRREHN